MSETQTLPIVTTAQEFKDQALGWLRAFQYPCEGCTVEFIRAQDSDLGSRRIAIVNRYKYAMTFCRLGNTIYVQLDAENKYLEQEKRRRRSK